MEKIVFLEQNVEKKTPALNWVVEVAKQRECDLCCIFLIPPTLQTSEWVEMQEKQSKEAMAKAEEVGKSLESELKKEGINFSWKVVQFTPSSFMEAVQESLPTDLIIAGDLDLEPLVEKGIKHLEDLSVTFSCPVLPANTLVKEKDQKGKIIARMCIFGIGSAAIYFGFYPLINKLNNIIYMKGGVLGALAVMCTVPIVAYIYGSFTEGIPKLMGLEKTAGHGGH